MINPGSLRQFVQNLWLAILSQEMRTSGKSQLLLHDMVFDRLLMECPVTGNPVEFVKRDEPMAIQGDELNGGQDEIELLLGQVVSKTQPCPSWLQSTVTLKNVTNR